MWIKRQLLFVVLFSIAAGVSPAQTQLSDKNRRANVIVPSGELDSAVKLLEGNAVMVYDGDTVSVAAKDGSVYLIRLQGIDAPEIAQPRGRESRDQLAALIQGMDVTAIISKRDKEDRYLASVYLEGQDVGLTQIKNGMAWNYSGSNFEPNAGSLKVYASAEQIARAGKIGLWRDESPVAPWEFRGEKISADQASSTTASKPIANSPKPTIVADTNSERKYILGPRGGCYYLRDGGIKVYVKDKSLCTK